MPATHILVICGIGILFAVITFFSDGLSYQISTGKKKADNSIEQRISNLEKAVVALAGKGVSGDDSKKGKSSDDKKKGKDKKDKDKEDGDENADDENNDDENNDGEKNDDESQGRAETKKNENL